MLFIGLSYMHSNNIVKHMHENIIKMNSIQDWYNLLNNIAKYQAS